MVRSSTRVVLYSTGLVLEEYFVVRSSTGLVLCSTFVVLE